MSKPMSDKRKERIRNRRILAGRIVGVVVLCAAALAALYRALGGTALHPAMRSIYRALGIQGSNPPAAMILGLMLVVVAEIPFMIPMRKRQVTGRTQVRRRTKRRTQVRRRTKNGHVYRVPIQKNGYNTK